MTSSRVHLKSPYLAGFLAFLLPGAGHWYQGRRFKATIFSVCILTVFVWGLILGNLQPVYSQVAHSNGRVSVQLENGRPTCRYTFGYYAQVLVGLPAFPSLIQQERFRADSGAVSRLDSAMESDFFGILRTRDDRLGWVTRVVRGAIRLEPLNPGGGKAVKGRFSGTAEDGTAVEVSLGREVLLGRRVFGSPRREIQCSVLASDDSDVGIGQIEGTIARRFTDWFQAPRDNVELDRLHGELSRDFDLASVFTWIAGLLNLLVIWDAVEGPAYGYGDEDPEDDEQRRDKSRKDPA